MEDSQQNSFHLRGDLVLVVVITLILSVILISLVFVDSQSGTITDLARKISGALVK